MQSLGLKTLKLKRLKLPGDIERRRKQKHVIELEKSLQQHGMLEPPLVRAKDRLLIAGRDRVAAAINLGWTNIEVKMVSCDDMEAAQAEQVENAHRRHDPAEQLERAKLLSKFYEQQKNNRAIDEAQGLDPDQERQTEIIEPKPERSKPGKKPSAKTQAIRQAARETGISEDTLRKARWREEQKAKGQPATDEVEAPILLLGMTVGDQFLAQVAVAAKALRDSAQALTKINRNLGGLDVMNQTIIAKVLETTKSAAYQIKQALPYSLCPYCKGMKEYRPECSGCNSSGFITEGQRAKCRSGCGTKLNPSSC